jgi:transcriptional regulator with XRE-family HTH domain
VPRLAEILQPYRLAEVARQIGRDRSFVWRLARGQPLRDHTVIPDLARVFRMPKALLTDLVIEDARRYRLEQRMTGHVRPGTGRSASS